MEGLQFNRTYELIIGKPNGGTGLHIIGDEVEELGLQINFNIKKNLDNKKQSNTCTIKLTNLSEESINSIQRKDLSVVLKVGYDGDNKVIFTGITSEIETDDNQGGQDRTTSIKCVPADSLIYSPTISKTFPANTTPRVVINYLIGQSTSLSKASFNSDNIEARFPFGYPVEGTLKQILDELSRDFDFQYRIDGNRLYVNDPNKYASGNSVERAFVISPDTGLIGVPTFASADGSKQRDDTTKKNGVKFKALLNPLLQPGQAITLKDSKIEGTYRINSTEFTGDWRGSVWHVTCHCSKLDATIR